MPEPLPSPEIWHRDDFYLLCEWRRLTRVVEVGVDRASFAMTFLNRIVNCELYIGVDPYLPYPNMPFDRSADFTIATIRFERHAGRAKLIRDTSENVARELQKITDSKFYSNDFGFIYIDGEHTKDGVLADINAWWPLLADNGIMAGHDWSMPSGDHAGVQEAVREFADARNLQIYFTPDDPASWYFYKSGIPGYDWNRVSPPDSTATN